MLDRTDLKHLPKNHLSAKTTGEKPDTYLGNIANAAEHMEAFSLGKKHMTKKKYHAKIS